MVIPEYMEDNMEKNKTLYAYLRVSTQQQVDKDLSLPEQRNLASKYAESKGMSAEFLEDAGRSAFDPDPTSRPSFASLLDLIKEGKVKYLWIWNYNRLSREQAASAALQFAIFSSNSKDLQIIQGDSGQVIRFDSPEASMMFSMINYQTVKSSEDFKKQMRRGHNSWLQKGGWPSPTLPYGYSTDENRHLIINEEEATVVREIFALRIKEKLGYTSIANALNKKGIPPRYKEGRKLASGVNNRTTEGMTSGKWERSSIRNILLNELYYGQRIIVNNDWEKQGGKNVLKGKKEISNKHLPNLEIISKHTFDKAQEIKLGDKAISNKGKYDALLKGMITCADCGNSVRPWISPNRGSYLYRCTHNRNTYNNREDRCWSKGMNITMVNDLVYDSILASETYQEVITELFDDEETRNKIQELETQKTVSLDNMKGAKKAIERNQELFNREKIEYDRFEELDSQYRRELMQYRSEVTDLETILDHLRNQSGHEDDSKNMLRVIDQYLKNCHDLYNSSRLQYLKSNDAAFSATKQIFRTVVDKVELKFHNEFNIHKVIVTFKSPHQALEELKKLPKVTALPNSDLEHSAFITKTVNKHNPIENRGMSTSFYPSHDYEELKKHLIDVPFYEAVLPGSVTKHDLPDHECVFVPNTNKPKSFEKVPTIKVVYEYVLGDTRREVDKIVFYSD